MPKKVDPETTEVIAPNLKRRLSGVTSTIMRLVPIQAETMGVVSFGAGLPDSVPKLSFTQLLFLRGRKDGKARIWHARRNVEMLLGLIVKHLFRKRLKLLFTSAAQRQHSGYTKFLIRQMDGVVATSDAAQSYLDVPSQVIHHGINITEFQPPESTHIARQSVGLKERKLIGCFGRVRANKGTDLFVETMLEVLPQHPEWDAIILGRTTSSHQSFQEDLLSKIAAAGMSERIRFLGEVPETPIYYQSLSLFVAPQRWEGFGLTPLEAMACGVPVVATKVGAFPQLIVEGETGHLIEPENLEEMIAATKSMMSSDEKLARYSKAARTHMVENFQLQNEADALMSVYRDMLKSD